MSRNGGGGSKRKSSSACVTAAVPKSCDKHTATPPEFMTCPKCQLASTADAPLLADYVKSINYINTCHAIINKLIDSQKPAMSLTLPDLPNFVSVFAAMSDRQQKKFLGKIESLEEVFAHIDALEERPPAIRCEGGDVFDKDYTTDEEKTTASNVHERKKNSNIPRPVSTERKAPQVKSAPIKKTRHEETKRTERTSSSRSVQKKKEARLAGFYRLNDDAQTTERAESEAPPKEDAVLPLPVSQADLDKFAKELLTSCTNSPQNSPRTESTISQSLSPRNRKGQVGRITYKTKSDHCLKVVPKPKTKLKTSSKTVQKAQRKRSITICEPSKESLRDGSRTVLQQSTTTLSPRPNGILKRTPRQQDDEHSKSRSQPNVSAREQGYLEDVSDIEPDDSRVNSNSSNHSSGRARSSNVSRTYVDLHQSKRQYVVKQKPTDFFIKRRDKQGEVECERGGQIESDIDDDAFENEQTEVFKKVNHMLKMSASRQLTNTILSNIGILTQNGKMKPEKEMELERLNHARSQDKQNSSFRQPRNRQQEEIDEVVKMPDDRSRDSSRNSSDIKSDDEAELCSHRVDSSTAYKYRF